MADLALSSDHICVVAEMANAHGGDLETALGIVEAAAAGGADAVKLQAFTPDELAVPQFEYYKVYCDLQMDEASWGRFIQRGHGLGLAVFADVFGLESSERMQRLGVDGYKIHAADTSNRPLLERVGQASKAVLLSTGGSTGEETAGAVATLKRAGAGAIVLMHGFQSYPTRLEDSHLRRIETLRARFGLPVGFAGHVDGGSEEALLLPVLAAAAGAGLVEVHLTLNRARKGYDYFSALDPEPFAEMVRRLRSLTPALGSRDLTMPEAELKYRAGHKKVVVAARDLTAGQTVAPEDVALKRVPNPPPDGISGLDDVYGHRTLNRVAKDSPICRKGIE